MGAFVWERLPGTTLEDAYSVGVLLQSGRGSALFAGRSLAGATQAEVAIQAFEATSAKESEELQQRFREASFLQHANLARVLHVGRLAGSQLVYAVCEPVQTTLLSLAARRPIPVEEARRLTADLAAGLTHLHAENFVFGNMRAESIYRSGGVWKLADFSQLRLPGQEDAKELRLALGRRTDLAPEVYQGVVSPAMDVWSLGTLLRSLLVADVENAQKGRQLRESPLPAPFDAITAECLDPDPAARISPAEIAVQLEKPAATTALPPPSRPLFGMSATRAVWSLIAGSGILGICFWVTALARSGERGKVEETSEASRAKAAAPAVVPATRAADRAGLEKLAVQSVLTQWVESTKTLNPQAEADCYAPMVDTYYTEHHLSRQRILEYKKAQFAQLGMVNQFEISNVQIKEPSPGTAVVVFDKTWDFGTVHKFSGAEREQLTLNKFEGEWKIVSERELKLYWVRGSASHVG